MAYDEIGFGAHGGFSSRTELTEIRLEARYCWLPEPISDFERRRRLCSGLGTHTATFCPTSYFLSTPLPSSTIVPENLVEEVR